jgi:hypothetical protein
MAEEEKERLNFKSAGALTPQAKARLAREKERAAEAAKKGAVHVSTPLEEDE